MSGLIPLLLGGLAMVPAAAGDGPRGPVAVPPLVRSARSGPWSSADTWEGAKLPGPGARVQIRTGHTVVYDIRSEVVLRSIHVAGTLAFPGP